MPNAAVQQHDFRAQHVPTGKANFTVSRNVPAGMPQLEAPQGTSEERLLAFRAALLVSPTRVVRSERPAPVPPSTTPDTTMTLDATPPPVTAARSSARTIPSPARVERLRGAHPTPSPKPPRTAPPPLDESPVTTGTERAVGSSRRSVSGRRMQLDGSEDGSETASTISVSSLRGLTATQPASVDGHGSRHDGSVSSRGPWVDEMIITTTDPWAVSSLPAAYLESPRPQGAIERLEALRRRLSRTSF